MSQRSFFSQSYQFIGAVSAATLLVFAFLVYSTAAQKPQNDPSLLDSATPRPDLYSAAADSKKEIADALARALTEKKRILLMFGANWCYDCHVLDRALHEGAAAEIVRENFLLVHVDIGEGEKNPDLVKTYKIPLDKGVPAVAVLDADGRLLYSSGEGEFESARRMLKKDLVTFLNHWKAGAK